MNRISIIGRISREIEICETDSGQQVARFNIASRSKRKDKEGRYIADFFKCNVWGDKAKIINRYCLKGTLIEVVGSMESREWTKKDGTKVNIWEVKVDDFEILTYTSEEREQEAEQKGEKMPVQASMFDEDMDEKLPF